MFFDRRKKVEMVAEDSALPGRDTAIPVAEKHCVLPANMFDVPEGYTEIQFAMGCFWGAERRFWQQADVYSTAVGYAGGYTLNPSYEEVCSGLTGHTEVVRVVYKDDAEVLQQLLKVFWEAHDPTQGMRQGNDIGTQYRSAIYVYNEAQLAAVEASRERFQKTLTAMAYDEITTEIKADQRFYYAEDYHQQYLHKNPNGYCGLRGTGATLKPQSC